MRLSSPNPHTVRHMLRVCLPCAAVCAGVLLAAIPSRAQDVAEAARQERARKAQKQKTGRHVYTDDDLKRAHILTPEDQARAEATGKNSPAAPANQEQQASDAKKNSAPESLGEIARRYRKEKEARAAEEALKKQPSSGYPMNVPAAELAAPKNLIPPKAFVSPRPRAIPRGEVRPPVLRDRNFGNAAGNVAPDFSGAVSPATPGIPPRAPREFRPSRPFVPKRISPFQPRPYSAPRIPEAPSRDLRIESVAPLAPEPPARAPRVVPATPALPPVAAIHGKVRAVTVKAGDSWWRLSREYLGRGSRWQELQALNPSGTNPDMLIAGSEVLIPVAAGSLANREATNITVHRGDTLWSIARAHYGSGLAWTCLASANRQVTNPDLIQPGQVIQTPESCSTKP